MREREYLPNNKKESEDKIGRFVILQPLLSSPPFSFSVSLSLTPSAFPLLPGVGLFLFNMSMHKYTQVLSNSLNKDAACDSPVLTATQALPTPLDPLKTAQHRHPIYDSFLWNVPHYIAPPPPPPPLYFPVEAVSYLAVRVCMHAVSARARCTDEHILPV